MEIKKRNKTTAATDASLENGFAVLGGIDEDTRSYCCQLAKDWMTN